MSFTTSQNKGAETSTSGRFKAEKRQSEKTSTLHLQKFCFFQNFMECFRIQDKDTTFTIKMSFHHQPSGHISSIYCLVKIQTTFWVNLNIWLKFQNNLFCCSTQFVKNITPVYILNYVKFSTTCPVSTLFYNSDKKKKINSMLHSYTVI